MRNRMFSASVLLALQALTMVKTYDPVGASPKPKIYPGQMNKLMKTPNNVSKTKSKSLKRLLKK